MRTVLPTTSWVLHAAPLLGGLTDRWIGLQAGLRERYETRLIGARLAPDAVREPHWLVATDRLDLRLAYDWMDRSRGLSVAWAAWELRGSKPSIIHAHYGPVAAQHRYMARLLRSPLVGSFYGYDATKDIFRTSRRWRRQYEGLFREAAALVVEGPAMAARLEGLGCPATKVHVIRLPADARGLDGCRRPKADHFLVVAAGRLIEKKGFDTAIRAFARALGGRRDARLLITGGGDLEPSLRRLATSEGVQEQVVWGGRLPFRQFMAEISAAQLALYPSRTARGGDSEGGAPVTLIEAQWLGVPSLVSDHDDLSFVAAPDGSVVLPALDVDAWAEVLYELYRDPSRVSAMAQAAEAFVHEHHAPAVNLNRREALYDSL